MQHLALSSSQLEAAFTLCCTPCRSWARPHRCGCEEETGPSCCQRSRNESMSACSFVTISDIPKRYGNNAVNLVGQPMSYLETCSQLHFRTLPSEFGEDILVQRINEPPLIPNATASAEPAHAYHTTSLYRTGPLYVAIVTLQRCYRGTCVQRVGVWRW